VADAASNFFEIQRRAYMWDKNSTLDDGITSMLWDNDPNTVVNGNTPGETKLYAMPPGSTFFQSNGDWWQKTSAPNIWVKTNSSGVTDHGALTGLYDDDHTQYILVDGSRGFSSTISGVSPIEGHHLVTKDYVDDVVISGVGITHGNLLGLDADDHTQYLTEARGDVRYYQQAEIDTISGSLSAEIDSDITTHAASADHDGRYYTKSEISTISGTLQSRTEDFILDATDISNKYVELANTPSIILVFVEGGIKGILDTDYSLTTNKINWNGKDWDGILESGDILSAIYWI